MSNMQNVVKYNHKVNHENAKQKQKSFDEIVETEVEINKPFWEVSLQGLASSSPIVFSSQKCSKIQKALHNFLYFFGLIKN